MSTSADQANNTPQPPVVEPASTETQSMAVIPPDVADDEAPTVGGEVPSKEVKHEEKHSKREKPIYDFSDPEAALQLPVTSTQFMEVVIQRPMREDWLQREKETKRVATVATDRSMTSDDNEDEANASFMTPLILSGAHKELGKEEPIKVYSEEELSKLTVEAKNRLFDKLGEFEFEVVGDEEDAINKLFETSAGRVLTIRQTIGDPDAPIFELFWEVTAPERPRRRTYLRDTFKVKRKTERKKTTLNTTFDMMKGVALTETIFRKVKGGLFNGKPSEECSVAEMMAEGVIDDMWKVGLADAAVGYFGDPEGK